LTLADALERATHGGAHALAADVNTVDHGSGLEAAMIIGEPLQLLGEQ
jgi:hypothetical protein